MRHLDKITHAKLVEAKLALLNATERKLYRLIAIAGLHGKTCEELVRATSGLHQTVSARLNELRRGGLLLWSGDFRPTTHHCNAHVHITVEANETRQ